VWDDRRIGTRYEACRRALWTPAEQGSFIRFRPIPVHEITIVNVSATGVGLLSPADGEVAMGTRYLLRLDALEAIVAIRQLRGGQPSGHTYFGAAFVPTELDVDRVVDRLLGGDMAQPAAIVFS
jgi:hypothetical protein